MARDYTLSEASVRKLREDHNRLAQQVWNLQRQLGSAEPQGHRRDSYIGKPQTSVTARSGNTPGTGFVDLWELNHSTGILAATARSQPVYNLTETAYTSTDLFGLHKIRGRLFIVGGGGEGGDGGTNVVKVTSSQPDETGYWQGRVVTAAIADPTYCSFPGAGSSDCKLHVLNLDGGTCDTFAVHERVPLRVGDHYIAHYLYDSEGLPVYAIRWTARHDVIEGYVYSAFNRQTQTFLVSVSVSYTNARFAGQVVEVRNFVRGPTAPADEPYLFEGEYGAAARATFDHHANVYRVDWVECPQRSPVEVYTPSSEGSMADMYAAAAAAGIANNYGY
mgnify:CR=1 FL=1